MEGSKEDTREAGEAEWDLCAAKVTAVQAPSYGNSPKNIKISEEVK